MSDRGSIKRPTLIAITCTLMAWLVTVIILRDNPFLCVFIAWPLEYIFFALILSNPFRVTLQRLLHVTRYGVITAAPTVNDRLWLTSNEKMLEKAKLRLYVGEDVEQNQEASHLDDVKKGPGIIKKAKTIKVVYE